ncbi:MAG: hypothetical protein MUO40_03135 [Anaerolineaceae bacterium]|nr:hypothetical protein [Anaerolineaceae bacterium]
MHFDAKVDSSLNAENVNVILNAYAKWGIRYVIFFDKPNLKSSWEDNSWSQEDLVERFLDRYLPFVKISEQVGLTPVFPPLQPGGDYWDITFLKNVLQSAKKRKSIEFVTNFHIAVSGQTFHKSLNWGKDAKENWKSSSPYIISKESQDHIGFRTSEWYSEMVDSLLGITPKIFLFWYGSQNHLDHSQSFPYEDAEDLINLINNETDFQKANSLTENIISCNFYSLSSGKSDLEKSGWFSQSGEPLINAVNLLRNRSSKSPKLLENMIAGKVASWIYPIDHYLLLPAYKWGIPENILEKVRPIIRETQATVGFSLDEAALARKVTIWNENSAFSDVDITQLQKAGCQVDVKVVNGMEIALEDV